MCIQSVPMTNDNARQTLILYLKKKKYNIGENYFQRGFISGKIDFKCLFGQCPQILL